MDHQTEEERPEFGDEGGPVKSFLEHLEDLRWMLIKSCSAVAVGMLLCLIGADYVVGIIKWPLVKADELRASDDKSQSICFFVGTNVWGTFRPGATNLGALDLGTNRHLGFELVTVSLGSNQVLALQPMTNQALVDKALNLPTTLRNFSPVGGFWVAFQVALYGGLVLGSPFIIYFLGQFALPALKIKEKKYVLRGFVIGTGLFLSGVAFCYFVLMRIALAASTKYSEWLGFSASEWRAEDYISFVCKFMLGMGLGFELPVVILTLVKIGILDHRKLAGMRRYMIVVNLILGAVLTTPEVVTQVLMFIPLQGLYELSVWIAWYWEQDEPKKRKARWIFALVVLVIAAASAWAYWYFALSHK
jgi:sec-independent protein translocase protein TatC